MKITAYRTALNGFLREMEQLTAFPNSSSRVISLEVRTWTMYNSCSTTTCIWLALAESLDLLIKTYRCSVMLSFEHV